MEVSGTATRRARGARDTGRPVRITLRRAAAVVAIAVVIVALSAGTARASAITLVDYPVDLVWPTDAVRVSWAEPYDCSILHGRAPGAYVAETATHGWGSAEFVPIAEGMMPGVNYCVVRRKGSSETSDEFTIIVESPLFPSPRTPANGSVLSEPSTLLEWDPVDGTPYYHVAVSDQEIRVEQEDGEITLTGANLIWQAITSGTSIQYGSLDPSGHFADINGTSPPLMTGFDYNWLVLNNYGSDPALSSVAGAGLAGFTVDVPVVMDPPAVVAPPDSALLTEELVEFRWSDVAGAAGYHLYIYETREWAGGEASYPVWDGAATGTSIDVQLGGLLVSGVYVWKVIALDANGRGVPSETRRFEYSTCTGTAHIRTRDDQGRELPRVLVEITLDSGGGTLLPVVTNESGIFNRDLVPGEYSFRATKDDYVDTTAHASIEADQTANVHLSLRRAPARMRGSVEDELGRPVFGATVSARADAESAVATADPSGNFVIQATAADWIVQAERAGYVESRAETVHLNSGDYHVFAEPFVLRGTPATVVGSVLNFEGNPIAGATVRADSGDDEEFTTTTASGWFSLELASGEWSLSAQKSGFRPSEHRPVTLASGETRTIDPPFVLSQAAASIVGRVTDGDVGVAGSSVRAIPRSGSVVSTTTNARGEFTLLPPAGTYALTAECEGFQQTRQHQITVDGDASFGGVELRVAPDECVVAGTVLHGETPVEGAVVTDGTRSTVTLADGVFSMPGRRGRRALRVSKEGYVSGPPVMVDVAPGQELRGVVLGVAPGASTISGTVRHAGAAVPFADVTGTRGGTAATTRADAGGEYALRVDAGEWTLGAAKDGFAAGSPRTVTIAEDQSLPGVALDLADDSARIEGTLRDADGPLRRGLIAVFPPGRTAPSHRTSTSATGSFSVVVAAGESYTIELSADEHGHATLQTDQLAAGETASLHVLLPRRGGRISGEVTDDTRGPVEGARVVASWGDSVSVRTDHLGRYSLWLDEGIYDLRVERPGYRTLFETGIEVVAGVPTGLDPRLEDISSSLEGAVTESLSGLPVEGALVRASWEGGGGAAIAGSGGGYALAPIVPGPVEITVDRAGYRQRREEITLAESEAASLDICVLELAGTIGGRVTSDGAPVGIEGVSIRATLSGDVAASTTTDADGRYLLVSLDSEESYEVAASHVGYTSLSANPIESVPTGTLDADFVFVETDGTIAGSVRDVSNSAPLVGASVVADDGEGHFGEARTSTDGSFSIGGLIPASAYEVTTTCYGYVDDTSTGVAVGTANLTIGLVRNFSTLSGRIVGATPDVEMDDLSIVATNTSFGGSPAMAAPAIDGVYQMTELPPGRYAVRVAGIGYLSTPAQLTVEIGEGDAFEDVDFLVERATVVRVEISGPTTMAAGDVAVCSADAFAEDDRTVEADLAWWVAPASAGTIDAGGGTFTAGEHYIGEFAVGAREASSGALGTLRGSIYAAVSPTTDATFADSCGATLTIGPGAVGESKSIYLEHAPIPDARRYGRDFVTAESGYTLKPAALSFAEGCRPSLVVPCGAGETGLVVWNRDDLRWESAESDVTVGGREVEIATLGEYATYTSSRSLGVSGIRATPNPFSPETGPVEISYELSSNDARMPFVTVKVYSMVGHLVRVVARDAPIGKGRVTHEWDGRTDSLEMARNGRYVVEIEARDSTGTSVGVSTLVLVK